jgi:6-phosphogluconolactonase
VTRSGQVSVSPLLNRGFLGTFTCVMQARLEVDGTMRTDPTLLLFAAALLGPPALAAGAPQAEPLASGGKYIAYVGTYTGTTHSKGVYAFRFDASTGELTSLGLMAESTNPSFLAVDPSRQFLYTANETPNFEGQKSGGVSAWAIDRKTGKLAFLNEVPSGGAGPCYVTVDKTGRHLLVANYDGGSVAVFPVAHDGRLGAASAFVQHTGHGVNPQRQEGPHAHAIELSPDNRFAIAADLGLDELLVYRFEPSKGTLTPYSPPFAKVEPGAGPRHFAFHPNGKFVYVINEMQSSVTAFSYDAGALRNLGTVSTLPKEFKGNSDSAEIVVHPTGRFLYGSNRGHDSIAVFTIDPAAGTLAPVEYASTGGKTPRNFAIDPTGSYLLAANQDSNSVVAFRIDTKTGQLTPTGQVLEFPSPVCITLVAID